MKTCGLREKDERAIFIGLWDNIKGFRLFSYDSNGFSKIAKKNFGKVLSRGEVKCSCKVTKSAGSPATSCTLTNSRLSHILPDCWRRCCCCRVLPIDCTSDLLRQAKLSPHFLRFSLRAFSRDDGETYLFSSTGLECRQWWRHSAPLSSPATNPFSSDAWQACFLLPLWASATPRFLLLCSLYLENNGRKDDFWAIVKAPARGTKWRTGSWAVTSFDKTFAQ